MCISEVLLIIITTRFHGEIRKIRAHLFKTNDVVSKHIVKTLIIKHGIYANIFAEQV